MRNLASLALMSLAACTAGQSGPPDPLRPGIPPAQEDTCQARPFERLLGQDATALERELVLRQVRVIRPGDAVTMDFRPERLNFEIGTSGQIVRIFCG